MKRKIFLGVIIVIVVVCIGVGVFLLINNRNSSALNDIDISAEDLNNDNVNILIAYYSYNDNVLDLAKEIQNQTGGELWQIERAVPYTNFEVEALDEINNNTRPLLDNTNAIEDINEYPVIFVCYPVWWNNAPTIINSFLESYDLTGNVIIPFRISSSDDDISVNSLRQSVPDNVTVLEGLKLTNEEVTSGSGKEEIANWLSSFAVFK